MDLMEELRNQALCLAQDFHRSQIASLGLAHRANDETILKTAKKYLDFLLGIEETDPEVEKESNLVKHARRELEILGEEPETIAGYLRIVQAFADMGHSGGSASVAIPTINALLRFQNLKPLTDDENEWVHHTEETWGEPGGVWQNVRNSTAFSKDGGKTYYLLDEDKDENGEPVMHISEPSN